MLILGYIYLFDRQTDGQTGAMHNGTSYNFIIFSYKQRFTQVTFMFLPNSAYQNGIVFGNI